MSEGSGLTPQWINSSCTRWGTLSLLGRLAFYCHQFAQQRTWPAVTINYLNRTQSCLVELICENLIVSTQFQRTETRNNKRQLNLDAHLKINFVHLFTSRCHLTLSLPRTLSNVEHVVKLLTLAKPRINSSD